LFTRKEKKQAGPSSGMVGVNDVTMEKKKHREFFGGLKGGGGRRAVNRVKQIHRTGSRNLKGRALCTLSIKGKRAKSIVKRRLDQQENTT